MRLSKYKLLGISIIILIFIVIIGNELRGNDNIKLPTQVIEDWEDFEASDIPLLAAIPEQDIYLYGIKTGGVLLSVNQQEYSYDWEYLTPRFVLPRMLLADYNTDGNNELAIILYNGSGTGISIEQLHIIDLNNGQDRTFESTDYKTQLQEAVSFRTWMQEDELMGEILTDNQAYPMSLRVYQTPEHGEIYEKLVFGNLVDFHAADNQLTAQFGVEVICENFVTPLFIGVIHADVHEVNGKFSMSNYRFADNFDDL